MSEIQKEEKIFIVKTVQETTDVLVQKAKTYGEKLYDIEYVKQAVDTGKDIFDARYKQFTDITDSLLEKSRNMKKDAVDKVEDIYTQGKNLVFKNPMIETIEKKASAFFLAVPSFLNLPEKDDVEKLVDTVEALDKRIVDMDTEANADKA